MLRPEPDSFVDYYVGIILVWLVWVFPMEIEAYSDSGNWEAL